MEGRRRGKEGEENRRREGEKGRGYWDQSIVKEEEGEVLGSEKERRIDEKRGRWKSKGRRV